MVATCLDRIAGAGQAVNPYYPVWSVMNYSSALNSSGACGIEVQRVAVDPSGNVIAVIGGFPNGIGGSQVKTINVAKISAAGKIIWQRDITDSTINNITAEAVTTDASGNIYVAGGWNTSSNSYIYVRAISAAGGDLWLWNLASASSGHAIAVDSSGVYVGSDVAITKLTLGGIVDGTFNASPYPGGYSVRGLYSDGGSGYLYASFSGSTCNSGQVLIFNSANGVVYAGPQYVGGGRIFHAPDGHVYVAPTPPTPNYTCTNGTLAKVDTNLNPIQSEMLQIALTPNAPTFMQTPSDLAWLPNGQLVCVWNLSGQSTSGGPTPTGVSLGVSALFSTFPAPCTGGGMCSPSSIWTQTGFAAFYLNATTVAGNGIAVGPDGKVYIATGTKAGGGGGSNPGSCSQYGVIALDDALAQNPVKQGSMQIRRNVIKPDLGGSALIVLKGSPNANVTLSVFGPSGNLITVLPSKGSNGCSNCSNQSSIQLDSSGEGVYEFDGTYEGTTHLGFGLYWIVAGDGVTDRKPVVISKTK